MTRDAAKVILRVRISLTCNECGKTWRVSPDSDPQCPRCNGVDYEVSDEAACLALLGARATSHLGHHARAPPDVLVRHQAPMGGGEKAGNKTCVQNGET